MTATAHNPQPIEDRFAAALDGVWAFVRARQGAFLPAILHLICISLQRKKHRFARLAALIREGKTPAPFAPRAPRSATPSADPPAAAPTPKPRLPSRLDWLSARMREVWRDKYDYWNFLGRGAFEQLLADPELQALHDAAPDQVGRLVRPLCAMLGYREPAWLKRPRRKRTRTQIPSLRAEGEAIQGQRRAAGDGPGSPRPSGARDDVSWE